MDDLASGGTRSPHLGGHGDPGPARAPLSRPLVGEVTGFSLRWEGQRHGALWITGDTVLFAGVREVPRRIDVGTVLLHLGGVRFPLTGPLRYTMTAAPALELCGLLRPHTVLPVHYEGWSHFREGREAVEAELGRAPADLRARFRWLTPGTPLAVEV
ncbi:MBL fold metallo-hydrolase [Streptomyces griseorubiginosus]|uniref:MBL fold metallo-hydrolase n=1 Tax=Streptomyces griseorubiginosus TaxID=67304 RepID=UPI0036E9E330